MFHTNLVVRLACGLRMRLCARALKVATILAAAACGLRGGRRHQPGGQRKQADHRDFHDQPRRADFLVFPGRVRAQARGFIDRRAQSARQLFGFIVRPEMQEEQARLLVQHMAVHGRYLDAV